MKLAVVPLPNERGCEVLVNQGEVAPRIFFIGRASQLAVLSGLLMCALAIVGTTYLATPGIKSLAAGLSRIASPSASPAAKIEIPHRPLVRLFDGSRPLKAGQLVILNKAVAGSSNVRKVAAAPNETVLLRRGNALHALYMAGGNSYVVMSGEESRIVPASQIHAVVPPVVGDVAR